MAFWKKSEDPWDLPPEKRRAHELAEPLELCPWCGKEMEKGYLDAVKGGSIWWVRNRPGIKDALVGADPKTSLLVDDEGTLFTHKTAWYCEACEKMVLDADGMKRPYDSGTFVSEEAKQPTEQGAANDL